LKVVNATYFELVFYDSDNILTQKCFFFLSTEFSKILIAGGNTSNGLTDSVEVIDLEGSSSICDQLKKIPNKIERAFGGLGFDDKPIICGGKFSNGKLQICLNDLMILYLLNVD
jgi:hypothetical protein